MQLSLPWVTRDRVDDFDTYCCSSAVWFATAFIMSRSSPLIFTSLAAPISEQHSVADLDVEGYDFAGLVAGAGTDGDDFALLRLLFGRIGNDDAACGLCFFLDAFH